MDARDSISLQKAASVATQTSWKALPRHLNSFRNWWLGAVTLNRGQTDEIMVSCKFYIARDLRHWSTTSCRWQLAGASVVAGSECFRFTVTNFDSVLWAFQKSGRISHGACLIWRLSFRYHHELRKFLSPNCSRYLFLHWVKTSASGLRRDPSRLDDHPQFRLWDRGGLRPGMSQKVLRNYCQHFIDELQSGDRGISYG